MSTSNTSDTNTPVTEPDQDQPLELDYLLQRFSEHAGTFQSFRMLQDLFNNYVATGALEAYTEEGLEEFMYHFTLISETVFDLETHAANDKIKEIIKTHHSK